MNDNSKNSGNKNVKSNRFLRADDHAQSIKKLFDLNVEGSSKIQLLKKSYNLSYYIPVDTRRRFNVYKTSIRRRDVV